MALTEFNRLMSLGQEISVNCENLLNTHIHTFFTQNEAIY